MNKKNGKVIVRVSDKISRHPEVGFLAGKKICINIVKEISTPRGPALKFFYSPIPHKKGIKEYQLLNQHFTRIST